MANVLVVDDDPHVRLIIRTLLEDAGHLVVEAGDGIEGLKAMGRQVPDLVITELYMDGMEGIEFIRRIRETWPKEPVLVVSSAGRPGSHASLNVARLLGASGLLEKPIVAPDLLAAVEDLLTA